ncbi:S8 family serine peptidase [Plantactinospora sp. B5E13]|uniref:S8 family serine peptidase n=1 Tax=Plantactinospora sp. B5E13 TaxID=3153758 RepID=UPI00325DC3CD
MWSRLRVLGSLLGCVALVAVLTQMAGPGQPVAAVAPELAPVAAPAALSPAPTPPTGDGDYVKYYTVPVPPQDAPESLTSIAGRLLGAPGRAEEIYRLNVGRRQPDGGALTDSKQVRAGWSLVLPWDAYGDGVRMGMLPTEPPASPTEPPVSPTVPPPSAGAPPVPPHGPATTPPTTPASSASPGGPAGPTPSTSAGSGTPTTPASPGRDGSSTSPGTCTNSVPSRPDSGWARDRMAADQAWGRTQGEGVLVAVVDSGVDASVPELSGRVALGADIPTGRGRGDVDCLGSGTAMASILGARPTGSDAARRDQVVGMAPGATILPLRVVAEAPQAKPADSATAIEVAVTAGARVVALGGFVDLADNAVQDAIRSAVAHDVVVVAGAPTVAGGPPPPTSAAPDGSPTPAPAALDGLLRVAGVGPDGQPASNYRPSGVDVTAPGIDVATLGAGRSGVRASSGSQYAVAYVAGAVTLVRSAFPNLNAAQVAHRIKVTADRAGQDGPDPAVGWGMVNPNAAVTLALAEEAPPRPAETDGFGPVRILTISLLVVVGLAAAAVLTRRAPAPAEAAARLLVIGGRRRRTGGAGTGPDGGDTGTAGPSIPDDDGRNPAGTDSGADSGSGTAVDGVPGTPKPAGTSPDGGTEPGPDSGTGTGPGQSTGEPGTDPAGPAARA